MVGKHPILLPKQSGHLMRSNLGVRTLQCLFPQSFFVGWVQKDQGIGFGITFRQAGGIHLFHLRAFSYTEISIFFRRMLRDLPPISIRWVICTARHRLKRVHLCLQIDLGHAHR